MIKELVVPLINDKHVGVALWCVVFLFVFLLLVVSIFLNYVLHADMSVILKHTL